MTKRLAPYGSEKEAANLSKVGKFKTPSILVDRMPSADIAAKVGGKAITPAALVSRMPSAEVASKVGGPIKELAPAALASRMPSAEVAAKVGISALGGIQTHRVVRRNRA